MFNINEYFNSHSFSLVTVDKSQKGYLVTFWEFPDNFGTEESHTYKVCDLGVPELERQLCQYDRAFREKVGDWKFINFPTL